MSDTNWAVHPKVGHGLKISKLGSSGIVLYLCSEDKDAGQLFLQVIFILQVKAQRQVCS